VRRKYLVTQLGQQYAPDSGGHRTVITVGEPGVGGAPPGQVLVRRPEVFVTIRRVT
jgi:hypothetical protein